jgi:hypothetical protein
MSNPARSRRRRSLRRVARCPDCNSDVRVISDDPRLPLASVEHDDTCPWFKARGGQPFRVLRLIPVDVA